MPILPICGVSAIVIGSLGLIWLHRHGHKDVIDALGEIFEAISDILT